MNKLLKEYQSTTKETNYCKRQYSTEHILTGLNAEVGEVMGVLQKYYRDVLNPTIDDDSNMDLISRVSEYKVRNKLVEEIGDVMWYISELCNLYNLKLETILRYNMRKVKRNKNENV